MLWYPICSVFENVIGNADGNVPFVNLSFRMKVSDDGESFLCLG